MSNVTLTEVISEPQRHRVFGSLSCVNILNLLITTIAKRRIPTIIMFGACLKQVAILSDGDRTSLTFSI